MNRLARDTRRWRLLVLPAVVLIGSCASDDGDGAGTTVPIVATSVTTNAETARTVDIGNGRVINIECNGTGQPTVVLVSGLGEGADTWTSPQEPGQPEPIVFAGVAEFSRVCVYDRPNTGSGRSSPVPQPTSAQDAAADLEALLTASGEPGPYVLVGHSYGSPIIRLFASAHPDDVAGLVLVDGLSEDLADGLTPAQQAVLEALNTPPQNSDAEAMDFQATFGELRESPPPPTVPVVVLTADRPQLTPELIASGQAPPGVDQAFADALWSAQLAAQDELAAKFPGAQHVTATNSNHYIQYGNPQLVVDSIRNVVDTVRTTQAESRMESDATG